MRTIGASVVSTGPGRFSVLVEVLPRHPRALAPMRPRLHQQHLCVLRVLRATGRVPSALSVMLRGYALPQCQTRPTAAAHGFAVATRNVKHFGDTGVELIDPWQDR